MPMRSLAKLWFFLAIIVLIIGAFYWFVNIPKKNATQRTDRLIFPSEIDLGTVEKGINVDVDINVSNSTAELIELSQFSVPCGCMQLRISHTQESLDTLSVVKLAPRSTLQITVTVHTLFNSLAAMYHQVWFKASTLPERSTISIKAHVRQTIYAFPSEISLETNDNDDNKPTKLWLIDARAQSARTPLRLMTSSDLVSCGPLSVTTELPPGLSVPTGCRLLCGSLQVRGQLLRDHRTAVVVTAVDSEVPICQIPTYVKSRFPFEIVPSQLVFQKPTNAQDSSTAVTVNGAQGPIEVDAAPEWLMVTITEQTVHCKVKSGADISTKHGVLRLTALHADKKIAFAVPIHLFGFAKD